MAFEAFLTQDQIRPTRRRRLTYTLSLLVHGALLLVGVVYSFWHVEELSPPTVRVTFLSAATPPPPPPPPPAGGGAKKKAPVRTKPTVTPTVVQPKIVQPRDKPDVETPKKEPPKEDPKKNDDDDDDALPGGTVGGSKGGTIGGTIGGTVGGTVGGTPPPIAPAAPKTLPLQMAAQLKISGAPPEFPAVLRKPGANYSVMAKVCIDKTGAVENVTITKPADPLVDGNVVSAVMTWKYRPFMANNMPAPFCSFVRFDFKSE